MDLQLEKYRDKFLCPNVLLILPSGALLSLPGHNESENQKLAWSCIVALGRQ